MHFVVHIGDHHALGDLKAQPCGIDAKLPDQTLQLLSHVHEIEILGGDILPPLGKLLTGAAPHIAVNLCNHAVLLKDGNEFHRGQEAIPGMIPAHQRLSTYHVS